VRAAVGAVIVLAVVGVGAAVVSALVTPGGTSSIIGHEPALGGEPAFGDGQGLLTSGPDVADALLGDSVVAPATTAVIVHVLGAVRRPGIVEVQAGDRVIDAIAAAGGATESADVSRVNLARALTDGEQLYLPAVGEELPPHLAGPTAGTGGAGGVGGGGGAGGSGSSGLLNLNTADSAALQALPGVGPALAARIIAWRDANGPFRAVDELLAVSGIGEKTLAGFRDQVIV
jgi:competence protein ComEA